jgi:hypothetical protein
LVKTNVEPKLFCDDNVKESIEPPIGVERNNRGGGTVSPPNAANLDRG